MNRKTLSIAKVIPIVALSVVTLFLCGYGPERSSYTLAEINSGVLGNKIVLNSISDSVIGHEFNFVRVRENTVSYSEEDNLGSNNLWSADSIEVERDKTYYISLYVHNDSPLGKAAIAEDVKVVFNVPTDTSRSIKVNGLIESSNASPNEIWDQVTFTSEEDFNLVYIEGSAHYENNGIGRGGTGGMSLSDSIVTSKGVLLGYEELDGRIPGCYQYAGYVSIMVRPQFADEKTNSSVNYYENYISIGEDNSGQIFIGDGFNSTAGPGESDNLITMDDPLISIPAGIFIAVVAGLLLRIFIRCRVSNGKNKNKNLMDFKNAK
ncbi:MAG: hypothetical protein LBU37_06925 [Tannerellaceae bacterium]|jgi:hypothetical protein|nr:hypothetical protein [Tannerellaceae bacterium]